jgi:hypothetical protein
MCGGKEEKRERKNGASRDPAPFVPPLFIDCNQVTSAREDDSFSGYAE